MPSDRPAARRRLRAAAGTALLLGLVVVAGLGVRAGRTGAADPGPTAVPTQTATVRRTTVVERQQVAGTLGYAGRYTAVGGAVGVITRLPAAGAAIRRGQGVYEVDGRAVPLWFARRPAWREFRPGMADGPDVRDLEANLVALGHDPEGNITVDSRFSAATAVALRRWQRSTGRPRTGRLAPGQVVFLPEAIRVTAVAATAGTRVRPDAPVLTATSTRAVVTAALHPAYGRLVGAGDRVAVTLPAGGNTAGTVVDVSRAAVVAGPPGGGGAGDGGAAPVSLPVTVALADPRAVDGLDQAPVQVAITTQRRVGVLAVPINALLAAVGGGYEVALGGGGRVPVRTGLFDEAAGLVEVAGAPLADGLEVEVPAP